MKRGVLGLETGGRRDMAGSSSYWSVVRSVRISLFSIRYFEVAKLVRCRFM